MRERARHFRTGQLTDVVCDAERIRSIAEADPASPADCTAGWVSPALFDLQINGCDGHSFNSPDLTLDAIRHVVAVCRRHGIGAFCPTLITGSAEALIHGFATLR